MKTGKTLEELFTTIIEENNKKRDFVSPANQLQMTNNLRMEIANTGYYEPWDTAHDQIAAKLDIPKKYYDRMMDDAPELLADNVNGWLERSQSKYLVRTLDNDMRAFLSDRYRPLDNFDLLSQAIVPALQPVKDYLDLASSEITHKRMYLKMVNTKTTLEVKKGDPVQAGIVISNSEVGVGSIQIQPLIYRLVCYNGAIMQDSSIRKVHIGGRLDEGELVESYLSDGTKALNDKAFFAKVADVMRGIMLDDGFYATIKRLQVAANNHIEKNIEDVIEVTKNKFNILKGEGEVILRNFINGGDLTQWGLANAVTLHSQDIENYDRATELERIGGEILEMPASAWKVVAA